jgi:hypothetical protein
MPNQSTRPLPKVIRTVDRCWCDFSAGGLFEPFNVSHWERISVQRLKDDLERQKKADEPLALATESVGQSPSVTVTATLDMPRTAVPIQPNRIKTLAPSDIWSLLHPLNIRISDLRHYFPPPFPELSMPRGVPSSERAQVTSPSGLHSNEDLPLIRKEYDLRMYGLGVIVDLGWTR